METSHIVWLKDFQRNLEGSFLEKRAVFFYRHQGDKLKWQLKLNHVFYTFVDRSVRSFPEAYQCRYSL